MNFCHWFLIALKIRWWRNGHRISIKTMQFVSNVAPSYFVNDGRFCCLLFIDSLIQKKGHQSTANITMSSFWFDRFAEYEEDSDCVHYFCSTNKATKVRPTHYILRFCADLTFSIVLRFISVQILLAHSLKLILSSNPFSETPYIRYIPLKKFRRRTKQRNSRKIAALYPMRHRMKKYLMLSAIIRI